MLLLPNLWAEVRALIMAHLDRQSTDEVFKDIKNAAYNTWLFKHRYDDDYVKGQFDFIDCLDNYADNWYSIIGRMDAVNQIIFIHHIRLQKTMDFLRKNRVHYGYIMPNVLK